MLESFESAVLEFSRRSRVWRDMDDKLIVFAVDLWFKDRASAEQRFGPMSDWDTSKVTKMDRLFSNRANFNEDISRWNTSNVETFAGMFSGAVAFNQPLNDWNVCKSYDFSEMFQNSKFNQPLSNWRLNNAIRLSKMFLGATKFNQQVNAWADSLSSVQFMDYLFHNATAFNRPLCDWNVESVITMQGMFYNAVCFNYPLVKWNTCNVTNMSCMFAGAKSFNRLLFQSVENVTDMSYMFAGASDYNRKDIITWNTQNVITMEAMFYRATKFYANLTDWNVSKVEKMDRMFYKANEVLRRGNLPVKWLMNIADVYLFVAHDTPCGAILEWVFNYVIRLAELNPHSFTMLGLQRRVDATRIAFSTGNGMNDRECYADNTSGNLQDAYDNAVINADNAIEANQLHREEKTYYVMIQLYCFIVAYGAAHKPKASRSSTK